MSRQIGYWMKRYLLTRRSTAIQSHLLILFSNRSMRFGSSMGQFPTPHSISLQWGRDVGDPETARSMIPASSPMVLTMSSVDMTKALAELDVLRGFIDFVNRQVGM